MTRDEELPELAREWCRQLPRTFVEQLAHALRAGKPTLQALASLAVSPASGAALHEARRVSGEGDGPYLAGLVLGRLQAEKERPQITPVWTGPSSSDHHGRLTLAVLSDLIDQARQEIFLASYATVPSAQVRRSLLEASHRDVEVTLLLERPIDNPGFQGLDDPLPELPARRLCWPAAARGHQAAMHAKVLVIDRRVALVGSANLTGYALERNLECGLLIQGGPVPALLVDHLLNAEGISALREY